MRAWNWIPRPRAASHAFRPGFPAFRRIPLAGPGTGAYSGSIATTPPTTEPQLITAFFAFVTLGLFVAIAAAVADSVTTDRLYA